MVRLEDFAAPPPFGGEVVDSMESTGCKNDRVPLIFVGILLILLEGFMFFGGFHWKAPGLGLVQGVKKRLDPSRFFLHVLSFRIPSLRVIPGTSGSHRP